jgi:hypothetical protein
MRALMFLVLLSACGGPSRSQLAETPTATTPRTPTLAPPASTDDKDRYKLNEQFETMQDAQNAHQEAARSEKAPPPPLPPDGAGSAAPGAEPPPKKKPAPKKK